MRHCTTCLRKKKRRKKKKKVQGGERISPAMGLSRTQLWLTIIVYCVFVGTGILHWTSLCVKSSCNAESPKLPLICESALVRFYPCSCYFLFSLILAYLPAAANVNGPLWYPACPIREVAHVRYAGFPRSA